MLQAIAQLDLIAIARSCLICSTIAWIVWDAIASIARGIERIQALHQIPCSNCAYFTGNYRLKCPLHPYTALTQSAIRCRDFAHHI
jgi:hypothetical protein